MVGLSQTLCHIGWLLLQDEDLMAVLFEHFLSSVLDFQVDYSSFGCMLGGWMGQWSIFLDFGDLDWFINVV